MKKFRAFISQIFLLDKVIILLAKYRFHNQSGYLCNGKKKYISYQDLLNGYKKDLKIWINEGVLL